MVLESDLSTYLSVIVHPTDFTELKAHYHKILRSMPDDYEPTIEKLQDYLSDEQICDILIISDSTIANKKILDFLIERINCKEQILDLCDQLKKITISHDLNSVIIELQSG